MRVVVDATPLLVRSAGVKNYLYHLIQHLRLAAGSAAIDTFPALPDIRPLTHEASVTTPLRTFAGLATDAQTRVLDANKQPIKGLYAVGNDAASVMGGNYPGAGITLGPALTFGYVAGMALSQAAQPGQRSQLDVVATHLPRAA